MKVKPCKNLQLDRKAHGEGGEHGEAILHRRAIAQIMAGHSLHQRERQDETTRRKACGRCGRHGMRKAEARFLSHGAMGEQRKKAPAGHGRGDKWKFPDLELFHRSALILQKNAKN